MIGNDALGTYNLILYKDKQNILTRAKLSTKFLFTLSENSFSTFYDDSNQNWLVHFDSTTELEEFTQAIKRRGAKIIDNSKENIKVNDAKELYAKKDTHEVETVESHTKENDGNMLSDSSGTQIKADILSRMARMGQPILPALALKNASDISDSESDTNKMTKKPIRKPRRNIPSTETTPKQSETTKTNLLNNYDVTQQPVATYQGTPGPMVPVQSTLQYQNYPGQVVIAQPTVSPSYDPVNIFLSETRTQNTEIRMSLAELSSKLDEVLGKVRKEDVQTKEEKVLQTKIKALELQAMNLTKDLQVSLKTNEELERKLLDCNTVTKDNNERKIQELEAKLKEKELYIKELEAKNGDDTNFVKRVVSVAEKQNYNFNDFVDLCLAKPAYIPVIHILSNLKQKYQESEKIRRASPVKPETSSRNFAAFNENIQGVMNNLYQHILKNYDATNGTIPHDFITKSLPHNMKTAANIILKEAQDHLQFNTSQSAANTTAESSLSEFSD